ncbi:PhnA domain-containing protein [Pedobacter frigoris]|uniref:PhnA domain-containing protein n=1 Tax=Pedobacter frigoris TaxID=2571272 RepID=UPI002931B3FA|nr:PhnA domain-containing protein [Pedobacter frigoris]
MSEQQLLERSGNKCELCEASVAISLYEVQPQTSNTDDNCFMICDKCRAQVEKTEELDNKHLGCLRTSIWSAVPGVQVVTWRLLNRLKSESWAVDSLDSMYLDEETLAWAQAGADENSDTVEDIHKDCNGAPLQAGDTVVLIKSLDVKGSQLNAKMGTVVKNIRLVHNNTDQIEGKIEGQTIVILTKYVRKQGA